MARLAEDSTLRPSNHDRYILHVFPSLELKGLDRFEEMLDSKKGSADVDGVCLLPDIDGHVPDGVGGGFIGYAGVGAEDVEGAEVGYGGCYGGGDCGFRGDVAL